MILSVIHWFRILQLFHCCNGKLIFFSLLMIFYKQILEKIVLHQKPILISVKIFNMDKLYR
jgi:hypothetical protein